MDSAKYLSPKPFLNPSTAGTGTAKPTAVEVKPLSAVPLAGGEERRRSQRVLLRIRAKVHLSLEGKPTTHEVTTLSVNAHGAMIVMKQNLPAETRLILEHDATKEKMTCRVVRPSRDTPEGFHTALEFDSPAPDFWKIAFPPSHWRPEDA